MLVAPEELPHQPFHSITNHRAADVPASGDADAGRPVIVITRLRNHYEVRRRSPPPTPLQLDVLQPLTDALRLRQPLVTRLARQDGCFGGMLTVSRLRPFARRRFNT